MDPLSALACLASAAAEASPSDHSNYAAGGNAARVGAPSSSAAAAHVMPAEVPPSVSLSEASAEEAAAAAARHYSSTAPAPVASNAGAGGGGYLNGTYRSQYPHHQAQQHHSYPPPETRPQPAPSSHHHIFSYLSVAPHPYQNGGSACSAPAPAPAPSAAMMAVGNGQLFCGSAPGISGGGGGGSAYGGPYKYVTNGRQEEDNAEEEEEEDPHHSFAHRKPPSLAKYMASLGKGMPQKQRKQRPKRSSATLHGSRSSSRSSSPAHSNHSDGGTGGGNGNGKEGGGGPPDGGIITEDETYESESETAAAAAADGNGGGRSKRKSATAARSYLQRVMRDGQGKKSTAALANSSPHRSSSGGGGSDGDKNHSAAATSANSSNSNSGQKRAASPTPNGGAGESERKRRKDKGGSSKRRKPSSSSSSGGARVVSNESTDGKKANGYDDSDVDMADDDASSESLASSDADDLSSSGEEEADPEPSFQEVKPDDLSEESRVLIAYRNSLYKATIRKVRTRDGKGTDYLIHYDGNKKSNVHWVSLAKFQARLDEQDQPLVVPLTPEEKKAREDRKIQRKEKRKAREARRKKKEERRLKRLQKQEASAAADDDDADHDIKNDADDDDDDDDESDEDWEYPRGKDVYVEYEDRLYRCTVLNRRKKRGHYQYFVYWDGFKKTHNSWVKEENVEKVTAYSSRRFNKQSADESSDSEEEEEWEYPIGKDVYIESDELLYRATVMNRRTRKGSFQYLVHYDGYKKASDGWVKEDNMHKITAYTSRRFNKQNAEKEEAPEEESEEEEEEEEEIAEEEAKDDDEVEEEEYPEGTVVYVEYNDLLYRATVLDRRTRKGSSEFYVHYDGYKKTADRWVKYADVHKRTAYTSRRYNKERRLAEAGAVDYGNGNDAKSTASSASSRPKAPSEVDLSDEDNKLLDMKGIQSGVEFLPGSSVFVKWKEALYLAKMVKRRIRAGETEYYITYNGFRDNSNAWVSLDDIYEINPQTRKIFEKKDTKQVRTKTSQEHLNRVSAGNNKKNRAISRQVSRQSSTGSISGLDALQDVDSGVTFMPGSTLFAKVGDEFHLAKMVRKRGSFDTYMEYFVSYVTKKKKTVDVWVKLDNCYEINAQTKRIYNKQK